MRTFSDTFTRSPGEEWYCNAEHVNSSAACTRPRWHAKDIHVAHDVTDDGQCEIWECE